MTCTITRSPLIERTKSQEMPLTRITFMFDAVEGESVTGTSLRSLCPMIIMMTRIASTITGMGSARGRRITSSPGLTATT